MLNGRACGTVNVICGRLQRCVLPIFHQSA
ncbi:MAG: hypothetical protein QOF90_2119, partial [Acetobacteraceae bacterium]|nr:hypothetical protein [Acetobacteraceae bacterium]